MSDAKPTLLELRDRIKLRDDNAVEDYNSGRMPGIEGQLALANGRATDALVAVRYILEYLAEREQK